jgi:hypothetical protein
MPAGEEFVVLRATGVATGEPIAFAQCLIDCLSEPFKIDGVTVEIGACAGLVCSEGAESLLSAADSRCVRPRPLVPYRRAISSWR